MTYGDLDLGDMVTKNNLYNSGYVLDICTKNEVDPNIGLGGVRGQTYTHTNRGLMAIIVQIVPCIQQWIY